MSLTVVAVVVGAAGAAMRLAAAVAAGGGAAGAAAGGRAADAADLIAADLSVATNFTERADASAGGAPSGAATTFTVPGRGAAALDTLRYAWSGGPDFTLTRQLNGGDPAVVARDVRQFSLAWLTRTVAPPAAAPDQVLLFNDNAPGATDGDWWPADANHWGCQTFAVPLPAGATAWGITRVRLMVKADANPDGVIRVQVRPAAPDHRPSAAVLDYATLFEVQSAASYAYVDVPFTKLQNLTPAQAARGLCLVFIRAHGSGVPTAFQSQTRAASVLANAWRCDSADAGAAWGTPTRKVCLRFYVYGTTR